MINTEYLGLIALIISITSFIPILYTVYKTKKTNNFPLIGLFLSFISNSLWIIYGIYKDALANVISGSVFLTIYSFILYIKLVYK